MITIISIIKGCLQKYLYKAKMSDCMDGMENSGIFKTVKLNTMEHFDHRIVTAWMALCASCCSVSWKGLDYTFFLFTLCFD